jgi:hypothetical protein
MSTRNAKPLTEELIDEMVIARADDDSAWDAPVQVKKRERVLVFHLEPGEAKAVTETAKARGVGKEALIRQWVLEKLEESKLESPQGKEK